MVKRLTRITNNKIDRLGRYFSCFFFANTDLGVSELAIALFHTALRDASKHHVCPMKGDTTRKPGWGCAARFSKPGLTLFKSKHCDSLYSIYYLTKHLTPYSQPDS